MKFFFLFVVFSMAFLLTAQMTLKSTDILNNKPIHPDFTPYGEDLNPYFEWEDVPKGTKSFCFTVEDPDAPKKLFYHWIVINIPAHVNKIERGKKPEGGIEIMNSWGITKYKGPRPPKGTHHYHFSLYALNTDNLQINLDKDFRRQISRHIIDKAEIIGTFKSMPKKRKVEHDGFRRRPTPPDDDL